MGSSRATINLHFLFPLYYLFFFFVSLQPSKELIVRDFEFRERMFTSITDLITLAIFLGISPPVKEGMTTYIRGNDKKDITPFRNFLKGKTAGFHKILEFCCPDYFFVDLQLEKKSWETEHVNW